MARIKPDEIVDDLSYQFRRALVQAVSDVLPDAQFDERELFRAFRNAVHRKCSTWETVKDVHVEV